jgi:hypothetical protein
MPTARAIVAKSGRPKTVWASSRSAKTGVDALLHEKFAEGLVDRDFQDGTVLVFIPM